MPGYPVPDEAQARATGIAIPTNTSDGCENLAATSINQPGTANRPEVANRLGKATRIERPHTSTLHTTSNEAMQSPPTASTNTPALQLTKGECSPANNLETLVSIIAKQAPAQAHWVGWSFGATLAMAAANQSPEKIDSITLISPTPCFTARPDWRHGFERSTFEKLLRLTTKHYAAGTKQFLRLQWADATNQTFDSTLTNLLNNQPTKAALQLGFDILCDTDLRSTLPHMQNPAMIIAAENDNIIPPAASKFTADHLPAASFETIGNGHALPLSHPQSLAVAIESFAGGAAS